MLFNSLEFAIFFPIVTALYFALPNRARVPWLVAASCVFYMAFVPKYLLILFGVILIDYVAGRLIEPARGVRRRWMLAISIIANVGILCVFKYLNFLTGNIAALSAWFGHPVPPVITDLVLPIGLSFHTFQSMSYTIEVYRGHTPAERSLTHFACYVLFYPQLVAGPIERPQRLLPQFHTAHTFSGERLFSGLRLMATGLFTKIIVADRLSPYVDAAYGSPAEYSGGALLMATYMFAIQIYCDFSGYSNIARGAARVMGIELMENFHRPYLASTFVEFWRRWHISLSTWFRDYLYVPLGGNRVGFGRRALNLFAVFAVSGIWHGANWTFVIWGLLHGTFIVAELGLTKGRMAGTRSVATFIRGVLVFNLTCVAWVFFRASSVGDAMFILNRMATGFVASAGSSLMGGEALAFVVTVAVASMLILTEFLARDRSLWDVLDGRSRAVRWSAYYLFVLAFLVLALTAPAHAPKPFIYFQF